MYGLMYTVDGWSVSRKTWYNDPSHNLTFAGFLETDQNLWDFVDLCSITASSTTIPKEFKAAFATFDGAANGDKNSFYDALGYSTVQKSILTSFLWVF